MTRKVFNLGLPIVVFATWIWLQLARHNILHGPDTSLLMAVYANANTALKIVFGVLF